MTHTLVKDIFFWKMGSAPSCFSSNIQSTVSSSSRTPSTHDCVQTPVVATSSDMHNKHETSASHRRNYSSAKSNDLQEGITLPTRLDDDVWSVSTTPDCAAEEGFDTGIQSLMKHKKSTSHFEAYIGWEVNVKAVAEVILAVLHHAFVSSSFVSPCQVYVDGLGIGRITKCITPSENELSFLLLVCTNPSSF